MTPDHDSRGERCPFCDYTGPSKLIAKSNLTFTIEPLNPVVSGHLLVIPFVHVSDFEDDPSVTGEVAADAARVAQEFPADYNLIASKGKAATQSVSHLHFHLVPRRPNDGLMLPWSALSGEEGARV